MTNCTAILTDDLRCACVLEEGHASVHRCQHGGLFPRVLPKGHIGDSRRERADVAAKQLRKLQWGLLEAALMSTSNAEFELVSLIARNNGRDQRAAEHEDAAGVHLGDVRRALGALALSMADGPDAAGYVKLFEAILAEPKVRRS